MRKEMSLEIDMKQGQLKSLLAHLVQLHRKFKGMSVSSESI